MMAKEVDLREQLAVGRHALSMGRVAEMAELVRCRPKQVERLIELPDPDLYAAMSGNADIAPEYAGALFDRIKSFKPSDFA